MAKYPNLKPWASRYDVIVLGSSWDAWVRGRIGVDWDAATTMITDGAPDNRLTPDGYRQPCGSLGTDQNWYQISTGDTVAEQARANDEAAMVSQAQLDRYYLWYPRRDLVHLGAVPTTSDIYDAGLGYYLTGPQSHPFALVIQSGWAAYDNNSPGTWGNYDSYFVPHFVALMQMPQYRKVTYNGIANRPVIGLYDSVAVTWDTTHMATLSTACTNAGLGTPFYIQMNGDVTVSNTLGCHGFTSYGPQGSMAAGPGQISYATQYATDKTNDAPLGLNASRIFPISHCMDNRPRPSGYTSWSDTPTYTEFEQVLRERFAQARADFNRNPTHMLHMYSLREIDEGGPFFPTKQMLLRGVNTPTYGFYLDAYHNVRNGTFPSVYNDYYHFTSKHAAIARTGGANWTITDSLWNADPTLGAFMFREGHNATLNDTWVFTSPYNVTRLKLYGRKAVGLGTFNVKIDAGSNTLIDQAALSTSYNQLLFDSGALSAGVHSMTITVVTGCDCDELVATVSR